LVLLIAIDQFRYDYLTRFRADYDGIKRLLTDGAVFTNANRALREEQFHRSAHRVAGGVHVDRRARSRQGRRAVQHPR
jgi:hypothetical protein